MQKSADTSIKQDPKPKAEQVQEDSVIDSKMKEKEIAELKEQLEEMTNRWKRAIADYQNQEKRMLIEKTEYIKFLSKNLIEKFLPVIDDLEKAAVHIKDQGLSLALKKLATILENEGVKRIEAVGKTYDVVSMEALSAEDGKEDNKVLEEYRAGYTMYGSVLRAAQVKVSKKSDK